MAVRDADRSPLTRRLLALGLVAGGGLLLLGTRAAGETFVFRDQARGQARGKVLVEFEDMLFVAIDGEPPQFVSRAELAAIVDDAGQRHEQPPLGTFGRVGGPAPVGAITDVEGSATLTRKDGSQRALGNGGPVFVRGGERLETGEAALVRLAFPSGAVVKEAPSTRLAMPPTPVREEVGLDAGEVFVETEHRPLELVLEPPISARLAAGAQATVRRRDATTHLQQHVGRTAVAWPAVSFTLEAGLGAELVRLQGGQWRITADPANPGPIELQLDGKQVPLEPGATRVVGSAGKVAPGEVWRLLRSKGDLLLRRGPGGTFALVNKAQRDRLLLGAGDALRTGPGALATLVRADGASVQLAEATRLDVAATLALARGTVTVDALEKPVRVEAPGGDASLRLCAAAISREAPGVSGSKAGAEPSQVPRPSGLTVSAVAGRPRFPVSSVATLDLDPKTRAGLGRSETGARVSVEAGQALLRSRAPQGGVDPGFEVELREDEAVSLPQVAQGAHPVLALPGERRLTFAGGTVGLRLVLRPKVAGRFASGARIELKRGLQLGVALAGSDPELRFRSGPRLRLQAPYQLLVENPTVRISGRGGRTATAKLEGDLAVSLLEGGPHSAAALGIRASDRLELYGGVIGSLVRGPKTFRFALGPRRLWIENEAPPVQALLGEAGTLFLSMPETPGLGLAPQRPITVLATKQGEFVVLDEARLDLTGIEGSALEQLSGPASGTPIDIARDRIPDLLDVPPPDSPSGP